MMITGLKSKTVGMLKLFPIYLFTLFIATGCLDKLEDQPQIPSAVVAIYHGSPDAPDLDIYTESRRINNQGLIFSQTFPYSNFIVGERTLKFNPYNAQNTLLSKTLTFEEDKVYSLFLVNKSTDLNILQVEDEWENPNAEKAQIRLVHLSPDSGDLEVSVAETLPFGPTTSYLGVTDFLEVPKGKVKVTVKSKTTGEELVSVNEIDLLGNRVYTLVVRGFADPANGSNPIAVQLLTNYIKF
jgi:hypothetical protein